MTDRKIMTSAAAIIAASFATASIAQDAPTATDPASPLTTQDAAPGDLGTDAQTLPGGTTDPLADPAADPLADPAADPLADPATDPLADPAADPLADPAADPLADPATDPLADPAPDLGTTDLDATGMGEDDRNYGTLISNLETGADFSAELEGLDADADIQIIRLSEYQEDGTNDAAALDDALTEGTEGLTTGRDALRENTQMTEFLEQEGFDADDVVSVTRAEDGSVEVIVDDRDDLDDVDATDTMDDAGTLDATEATDEDPA